MNHVVSVRLVRVGTKRMLELLEQICEGKGTMATLDELEMLASTNSRYSFNVVLDKLHQILFYQQFINLENEYIAHIVDKKCPAGVCKEIITICN